MSDNVINWAEVLEQAKSASFSVIPKGDYHVKIEEPNPTTASTGKPMIKFRARVMSGPHARASLLTQQVLTLDNPAAMNIFIKFLGAFGIGPEYLLQLGTSVDLTPIAQALDGREAIAAVEIKKWDGEDRNEVKRFKPLSAGIQATPGVGMPGVPGMPPAPGYGTPPAPMPPSGVPDAPMPGLPGVPTPGVPTPPPMPAAPVAPAAAVAPPPMPQAPPQAPQAPVAPVPPPAAPQAPQAAPQAPPQPPPAVAPPTAAPAFDFASLPPEQQQAIMAQMAQQQPQAPAAPVAPAPPAPPAAPPQAPAVVAPPLPY